MQNNGNPDPQEFGGRRIMIPSVDTLGEGGSFLGRQYQSLTSVRGEGGQPAAHTPNQAQDGGAGGEYGRNVRQRTDEVQASNQAQVGDGGAGFGRADGAGGGQPAARTPNEAGGFSAIRNIGRAGGAGGGQPTTQDQAQGDGAGFGGVGGVGGYQPAARTPNEAQGDGAGFGGVGGVGGYQPAAHTPNQTQGDGVGGAEAVENPRTPRLDIFDFPPAALRHFDSPPRINPPTSPSNSDASSVSSQPQSPEI